LKNGVMSDAPDTNAAYRGCQTELRLISNKRNIPYFTIYAKLKTLAKMRRKAYPAKQLQAGYEEVPAPETTDAPPMA
jgi:hypothetical protein